MTLSAKALRQLSSDYRTPGSPFYLASAYRILLELKRAGNKRASLADVKLFLASDSGALSSRFNPVRSNVRRPAVICSALDQNWESDLLIFDKKWKYRNSFYTCLLVVIDCLSLYLWAYPLKRRSKSEIAEKFASLFAHRRPIILTTDGEAAFKNPPLYERFGVKHVVATFSAHKARIVESLGVRLLQRAIARRIASSGDTRLLAVLPDLVKSLNDRYVPELGLRPSQVNVANSVQVYRRRYGRLLKQKTPRSAFRVGDKVRVSATRRKFEKASRAQNFSNEIYVITKRVFSPPKWLYHIRPVSKKYEVHARFLGSELTAA